MQVFLNDTIISAEQAHISIHDRGFLLGDGLFETIKATDGCLDYFTAHYQRLAASAKVLALNMPYTHDQLFALCQDLLLANQLMQQTAVLRITLTRGESSRGIAIVAEAKPTLLITAKVYEKSPLLHPRAYITDIQRNHASSLLQHKTLQYMEPIMARQQAQALGFDEGIMLNTQGCVTESSVANLFFIYPDRILTPRIEDGVLPGIIRAQVITFAKEKALPLFEQEIPVALALQSEAILQTNSLIGIQALASINQQTLMQMESVLAQALLHR